MGGPFLTSMECRYSFSDIRLTSCFDLVPSIHMIILVVAFIIKIDAYSDL